VLNLGFLDDEAAFWWILDAKWGLKMGTLRNWACLLPLTPSLLTNNQEHENIAQNIIVSFV